MVAEGTYTIEKFIVSTLSTFEFILSFQGLCLIARKTKTYTLMTECMQSEFQEMVPKLAFSFGG